MRHPPDDIALVSHRSDVCQNAAQRALDTGNGDLATAITLIDSSRTCNMGPSTNRFEDFIDNIEFLIQYGEDIHILDAIDTLENNNGMMLSAQEELDAYRRDNDSDDNKPSNETNTKIYDTDGVQSPGSDTNQYPIDKSNDYRSKTNSSGSDTASTANSACPNCGTTLSININPNYCPQCGADL